MVKQFRLDKGLKNELHRMAERLSITESLLIRNAILGYINELEIVEELIDKYKMDTEDILRLKRAIKKMVK